MMHRRRRRRRRRHRRHRCKHISLSISLTLRQTDRIDGDRMVYSVSSSSKNRQR